MNRIELDLMCLKIGRYSKQCREIKFLCCQIVSENFILNNEKVFGYLACGAHCSTDQFYLSLIQHYLSLFWQFIAILMMFFDFSPAQFQTILRSMAFQFSEF